MLFVDVRGFTQLAESLSPSEIVRRLNRFYELATSAVIERDGTLDKLVGDQVVAFFGTPYNEFGVRRWFGRARPQLERRAPAQMLRGDWRSDQEGPRRVRELARALIGPLGT